MEPVRTGLRQIMTDLLRARPAEEAVLLAWPLVCGREVAARSQAVSFHDGNLVVEVPDPVWRKQLQSFTARYVSGYEGLLGPVVRNLQFKIQQSASSSQQSAHLQQSAISTQQSTKPVSSNPTGSHISTDSSNSIETREERFQDKRMRRG